MITTAIQWLEKYFLLAVPKYDRLKISMWHVVADIMVSIVAYSMTLFRSR